MEHKPIRTRTRTVILYFILSLIMLLTTLVLGEVVVRVAQTFGPTTFTFRQFDDELGVSLIPGVEGKHKKCYDGYVSINEHGMRDKSRSKSKPADVFRIGVFSDSLIEAVHVKSEETATYLLEERLNSEICNNNCEVLNFSVGGNATLQYYLRYQRNGKPFDLDLVLLVFTDNDLSIISEHDTSANASSDKNGEQSKQSLVVGSLYPSPTLVDRNGKKEIIYPTKPPYADEMAYLFKHSSLAYMSYKIYSTFIAAPHTWAIHDVAPTWAKNRPNALFLDPDNEFSIRAWSQTEYILDQFVSDTKKNSTDFMLVNWGYDEGSNPWYAPLPGASELPQNFNPNYASQWFESYGKKNGIEVYDMGKDLGEYVRQNKLERPYLSFSCDMHYNSEGQKLIADLLFEQLTSKNMIKLASTVN